MILAQASAGLHITHVRCVQTVNYLKLGCLGGLSLNRFLCGEVSPLRSYFTPLVSYGEIERFGCSGAQKSHIVIGTVLFTFSLKNFTMALDSSEPIHVFSIKNKLKNEQQNRISNTKGKNA